MSAVLERKVWFPLGGLGRIYPNQYIVLCGGPGTGKTTASNLAVSMIKRFKSKLGHDQRSPFFGPDKATPAAMLLRMRQTQKTIASSLGNFEQSAMFLHSTELATMIKDIGGGAVSDDLLKLYDCDDAFEKELVGAGTIKIVGPCLNLLADTTPTFLSGFLPSEESGTGLTARIIFATELGRVDMDEEVPDGNKDLEASIINHIARMHTMTGPFQVSLDAQAWWKEWFPSYRDRLFELIEGSYMRHFYARKAVHVRKVAMALSAGRDSSRIIRLEDYTKAAELIEEAEPFMDKSFGVKDFRKIVDASRVIVSMIPTTPREIVHSDLVNALYFEGGLAGEATHFEGLLNHLVSGGIVRRRVDGNGVSFYSRPQAGA